MADSSDRDLITQTLLGDLKAYGARVRAYQTSVFNDCRRILENGRDAEDLFQGAVTWKALTENAPSAPGSTPWQPTCAPTISINVHHLACRFTMRTITQKKPPETPGETLIICGKARTNP